MKINVNWILKQVKANDYEYSSHADKERQSDKISVMEIEKALMTGQILEEYPDDQRGTSCLVLGYGNEGYPIHIVCGRTLLGSLRIITVYIPSPPKWINEKTRRRQNEKI